MTLAAWRHVRRSSRYAGRVATGAVTLACCLIFGARGGSAGEAGKPQTDALGTAAYSYRIESAARVHGLSLGNRHGCAVLDCSLLGRSAWVFIAGQWLGPLRIVDCTAAHHRHLWAQWRRVIDLPWSLWQTLGLWLAPVPAYVAFDEPRHFWY